MKVTLFLATSLITLFAFFATAQNARADQKMRTIGHLSYRQPIAASYKKTNPISADLMAVANMREYEQDTLGAKDSFGSVDYQIHHVIYTEAAPLPAVGGFAAELEKPLLAKLTELGVSKNQIKSSKIKVGTHDARKVSVDGKKGKDTLSLRLLLVEFNREVYMLQMVAVNYPKGEIEGRFNRIVASCSIKGREPSNTDSVNELGFDAQLSIPSTWKADSAEIIALKKRMAQELSSTPLDESKLRLFGASPAGKLEKATALARAGVTYGTTLTQAELALLKVDDIAKFSPEVSKQLQELDFMNVNKSSIQVSRESLAGAIWTTIKYKRAKAIGEGSRIVTIRISPWGSQSFYFTTSHDVACSDKVKAELQSIEQSLKLELRCNFKSAVSTVTAVPNPEHFSVEELSARVEKLEQRNTQLEMLFSKLAAKEGRSEREAIEKLLERVAALEKNNKSLAEKFNKPQNHIKVIDSGKWRIVANWRKLKNGMSQEQVIRILGQPTKGGGTFWKYGKSYTKELGAAGQLQFGYKDLLVDWSEPDFK